MQLTAQNAIYYELMQDNEIVGAVFAVNHREYIEIVDLFVNEKFQGQGNGQVLLRTVLGAYPYSTICLRCEAFGNGLSQKDLIRWYWRWDFEDGSPFHEGNGWMHKKPRRQ